LMPMRTWLPFTPRTVVVTLFPIMTVSPVEGVGTKELPDCTVGFSRFNLRFCLSWGQ
jgi:hypothetical protein